MLKIPQEREMCIYENKSVLNQAVEQGPDKIEQYQNAQDDILIQMYEVSGIRVLHRKREKRERARGIHHYPHCVAACHPAEAYGTKVRSFAEIRDIVDRWAKRDHLIFLEVQENPRR